MKTTLIIGCARTEIINYVEKIPQGNEEANSLRIEQRTGGNGFLSAWILQSFSFPYTLIAPVGTGIYAEYVLSEAEKHGIELNCRSDETDGCAYIMADRKGQRSTMIVPGGEYVFDREYLQTVDTDEIDNVLIFSEMLSDEYGLDILEAADEFDKPVTVVFDNDLSELDYERRKALLALQPRIILTDQDLYYLHDQKQMTLDRAAEDIHHLTGKTVLVLQDGEGCYVCSDGEGEIYQTNESVSAGLFGSFLTAAEMAGARGKKAVVYAVESVQKCRKMENDLLEERRKRLAEVIADS